MRDRRHGPLPHLHVQGTATAEPYTYPRRVHGGPPLALLPRSRGEHADHLSVLGSGVSRAEIGAIAVFEGCNAPGDTMGCGDAIARQIDSRPSGGLPLSAHASSLRTEGVGRVYRGSGSGILTVELLDFLRPIEHRPRAPKRCWSGNATLDELRPHRTVDDGDAHGFARGSQSPQGNA